MIKLKFLIMTFIMLIIFSTAACAAPISLNAKESNIHDTIMMIARMGGLNVSVDDSVSGTITIVFDNIEPIDALKLIAKTKDLKFIEENGTILMTYNYNSNALMKTFVLPIKYGDADKLREAVILALDLRKDDENEYLRRDSDDIERRRLREDDDRNRYSYSRKYYRLDIDEDYSDKIDDNEKRVAINKDVNALILYGTESEYERAKNLLREIDVPIKQVVLEAKVLAINKAAAKDLGVEWKWSEVPQYPDYHPTTSTSSNNVSTITEGYYTRNHGNSGYGIIQFGRNPEGISYEMYYGAKINALISNGKAKMLSRPHVSTIQGNQAIMSVGDRIPIPRVDVSNNITTTTYTYEDAGIILKVTPRVNEDGSITATVYTEVSTPQYVSAMGVYRFNKRSADTIVTLQDGEPMVIGGLIGKEEENAISKIPFLGDLPILGALFRNHHKSKSESELMIFLTAHVI